jgi:hypothetical protein
MVPWIKNSLFQKCKNHIQKNIKHKEKKMPGLNPKNIRAMSNDE